MMTTSKNNWTAERVGLKCTVQLQLSSSSLEITVIFKFFWSNSVEKSHVKEFHIIIFYVDSDFFNETDYFMLSRLEKASSICRTRS